MKKIRKDIIVIGALLAVGLVFLLVVLLTNKPGASVVVEVAGKKVASYPLDKDATYTIQGKDGGSNVLVIKDGYAYIKEASCPDGLCINMGKIRKTSQSVICLPNQVVVKIVGGEQDADIYIQ